MTSTRNTTCSVAGAAMACVAQFILGQTDPRECVPFRINRENVIYSFNS
ncbi:hypothetical protein [Hymenobacter sp. UV11]|nr:hypothetical protein [Hymenobacter sp. UV11]